MFNLVYGMFAFIIGLLPRVRLSKVVGILALCVGVWALGHVFPLELAMAMAGDWAGYFEVLAALGIMSANSHSRNALRILAAAARHAARRAIRQIRIGTRLVTSAFPRSRRSHRKLVRPRFTQNDDAAGSVSALA